MHPSLVCLDIFAPTGPSILKSLLKSFSSFKTQFTCHCVFNYLTSCQKKKNHLIWMLLVYLYIHFELISFSFHAILKGIIRNLREHANDIRKTRTTIAALPLSHCMTQGNILGSNSPCVFVISQMRIIIATPYNYYEDQRNLFAFTYLL